MKVLLLRFYVASVTLYHVALATYFKFGGSSMKKIEPSAKCNRVSQQRTISLDKVVILLVLILFSALSGLALWHHGFWGIFLPPFQSLYAGQIFADLVIALTLVMIWMWQDAKNTGRNPWPWIVATLAFGSFSPLLYLLSRKPGRV